MPYDSMTAWNRQAFEFNDDIQSRYAPSTLNHLVELASLTPYSGGMWAGKITFDSAPGRTIARDDYSPLPSPPGTSHEAPTFHEAKSQWSPPPSPRTRSLRYDSRSPSASSSRNSSPRTSPVEAPSHLFAPKSPAELAALADKLHAAACAGDLKHIRLLLNLGAQINVPALVPALYDAFKPAKPGVLSALAGAAGHGQLAAVKLLLSHGAALNPTMRQSSSSPLHQACKADDVEMSSYLLSIGADVDLLNCFNTSPLMYAGKYGSPALVRVVLAYNPDVHRLSFINTAAIHWSLWPGNEEVMELLLQAGADPNHPMGDGSTPLHCAALSDLKETARLLLMYGADPTRRNVEWKTPLQVAAEGKSWEVAGVLEEALERRS